MPAALVPPASSMVGTGAAVTVRVSVLVPPEVSVMASRAWKVPAA